jgi:hypothetical protein
MAMAMVAGPAQEPEGEIANTARQVERLREIAARREPSPIDARAAARKAKVQTGFREDARARQRSNWLARSFEALGRLIDRLFGMRPQGPAIGGSGIRLGNWLVYLAWAVLAAAALALIVLMARTLWPKGRAGRVGMLDENEPLRSSDEWLQQADSLATERRYREAVRCLFLASLMRLDEHEVARFERSHTNWEHHRRIMNSPKRPPSLDFTTPTKTFDYLWYGGVAATPSDYDAMRARYLELCDTLRAAA